MDNLSNEPHNVAKHQSLADQVISLRGDGRMLDRVSIVASNKLPNKGSIPLAQNPVAFALEARFETAATDPRDRRKGELDAYLYYFASLGRRKLSLSIGLVLSFVFFSNFPRQSSYLARAMVEPMLTWSGW